MERKRKEEDAGSRFAPAGEQKDVWYGGFVLEVTHSKGRISSTTLLKKSVTREVDRQNSKGGMEE